MKKVFTLSLLSLFLFSLSACGQTEPTTSDTASDNETANQYNEEQTTNNNEMINQNDETSNEVLSDNVSCDDVEKIISGSGIKAPTKTEAACVKGLTQTITFATSKGDIKVKLFADKAPLTVLNFLRLSSNGFYDGLIFHRVIKSFMIQGGDPLGNGTGGPDYQFEDEFDSSLRFDKPGMLAMANSGPGTNGSQFFITTIQTPWLNDAHTIFGEVVEGMDVLTTIENVATGPMDKPLEDVKINEVIVE